MAHIEIDHEKVEEVCALLVEALEQNEYPYNIAKLPQDYIPEEMRKDSLLHARILFGTCHFMRGTIQSDFAVRQMVAIYRAHPELFDPGFLSREEITDEYVYDRLLPFLQFRLFEIPRLWRENFGRLEEDWEGDPRRIFDGVTTPTEMYARIVNIDSLPKYKQYPSQRRGFVGFREKMASMLAYFLMASNLIEDVAVSTPVDFHNLRVLFATRGMVYVSPNGEPLRYETATEAAVPVIERICVEHKIPMRKLCDALWSLSVNACRRAPGNKTLGRLRHANRRRGKRHKLDYKPQARKKAELAFYQPDWSKSEDVRKHELSCGRCPLGKRGLCVTNVAAGFYYESGMLVMQPRTEPLPHLFGNGALYYKDSGKTKTPESKKKIKQRLKVIPGLLDVTWITREL